MKSGTSSRGARRGRTITLSEKSLHSVSGAQIIIQGIRSGRSPTKLILGHNNLEDDGCVELFNYLCSEEGRRHAIDEISLNSAGIGDVGLGSIARYLHGNETLRELFLQHNRFQGDREVLLSFTNAVNASRLRTLVLTSNVSLSDPFISHFMPILDSRHLRELHLSMIGLTPISMPHIEAYLSSPRCRPLAILKLNGNQLGLGSVRELIRSMHRYNFTLFRLEIYSNNFNGEAPPNNDDDTLFEIESSLTTIVTRNEYLKRTTENAAVELFRCARAVLLRPAARYLSSTNQQPADPHAPDQQVLSSGRTETCFAFSSLPTELQLYTLSFIAPSLSTAQRLRIFKYATNPSTLPSLLPALGARYRSRTELEEWRGFEMFGPSTPRDDARAEWLDAVGCSHYEPE